LRLAWDTKKKKRKEKPATYNRSYSGGRDQKDRYSKPALGNYFSRPYLEKSITKKGLAEWFKW
jgi:hypothetical protein